jgi:hypothetical protein
MTRKGEHPIDESTRRTLARLFQLHLLCHPKRVAAWAGVTPHYVRALWRRYVEWELADADFEESLKVLEKHARAHDLKLFEQALRPRSRHGKTDVQSPKSPAEV